MTSSGVPLLRATIAIDNPDATRAEVGKLPKGEQDTGQLMTDGDCSEIMSRRLVRLMEEIGERMKETGRFSEGAVIQLATAFTEASVNAFMHGNLERSSELKEIDDGRGLVEDLKKRTRHLIERTVTVTADLVYEDAAPTSELADKQLDILEQTNADKKEEVPEFAVEDSFTVQMADQVTEGSSVKNVVITVTDEGSGFDISTIPDPTDPENLGKPSGRGLTLIQLFADSQFNEKGNSVAMTKEADQEYTPYIPEISIVVSDQQATDLGEIQGWYDQTFEALKQRGRKSKVICDMSRAKMVTSEFYNALVRLKDKKDVVESIELRGLQKVPMESARAIGLEGLIYTIAD